MSAVAISAAIAVNARARSPTSSRLVVRTGLGERPSAMARAAAVIWRSGEVIPWASTWVTVTAMSRASSSR